MIVEEFKQSASSTGDTVPKTSNADPLAVDTAAKQEAEVKSFEALGLTPGQALYASSLTLPR